MGKIGKVFKKKEIGFLAKLLFASSSLGGQAITSSVTLWLFFFYAPPPTEKVLPLLIPTAILGIILFTVLILDTLDEAAVGFLSDKTRTRLGRRIPFILAGTPFWILFYILLWLPPVQAINPLNSGYLFLILWSFYFGSTLVGIPYESLLPEIAKTTKERVSIASYQVYFALSGAVFGLVLSGVLKDNIGFLGMAVVIGFLALITRLAGLAGAWHYINFSQKPANLSFVKAIKTTFKNPNFLAFLPSFVLFQIGTQLLIQMTPFYVETVLKQEREGLFSSILLAAAVLGIFTAVPFAKKFVRTKGKRVVYLSCLLGAALYFPLLFFMGFIPVIPPLIQSIILLFLAGTILSGIYLIPSPIIADIVDADETQTGFRREGAYYGSQNFFEKAAISITPLIFSQLLLLGSTPQNPLGIRLVGPVAGLFCFLAFLIFRKYKLKEIN